MATTLLIADDISIALDTLRMAFEKLGGQEMVIVTARSGQEAVRIARERDDLDLALLDYQMSPGTEGGVWAARQLRQARPDLIVVFVSAYIEPAKLTRAQRSGAAAYIAKDKLLTPDIFRALVEADMEALRDAARHTEDVWAF